MLLRERAIFLVTVANWVFDETTHIVGPKWNFTWWMVFRS